MLESCTLTFLRLSRLRFMLAVPNLLSPIIPRSVSWAQPSREREARTPPPSERRERRPSLLKQSEPEKSRRRKALWTLRFVWMQARPRSVSDCKFRSSSVDRRLQPAMIWIIPWSVMRGLEERSRERRWGVELRRMEQVRSVRRGQEERSRRRRELIDSGMLMFVNVNVIVR